MPSEQLEFSARRGGATQCDRILAHLQQRVGQWVPMPELHSASGSYVVHSRISDLRERGHLIDNRTEHVRGLCRSFYRLREAGAGNVPRRSEGGATREKALTQ